MLVSDAANQQLFDATVELKSRLGAETEMAIFRFKVKRNREPEFLIVKPGNRTYADLLKPVREISPKDIVVKVLAAKKNESGVLVLQILGKTAETVALRKTIEDKVPGLVALHKRPTAVVHVHGLEEGVTKEDVKD